MAKGVNKITLMGNLVKDPDIRFTPTTKQKVALFTLAVGDDYKDKSGEYVKVTEFINCVAWGNQAGVVEKYLSKGAPALLFGKLKIESYDKDGQKRYAAKVHVSEICLLSYAKKNEDEGGGAYDYPNGFDPTRDADIPY